MLKHLKEIVYEANMLLPKYNLVKFTWGNVSGVDRKKGIMAIKPSGVEYDLLRPKDIVLIEIESGKIIEGELNPSSDTPTHLVLYRKFENISGIVHTHSPWATMFAQSNIPIRALGTTHADTFYGDVPCTRDLTDYEINDKYEEATGDLIVETFNDLNYNNIPAVLVKNHGPFAWGKSPFDAVYNAAILEECAFMAWNNIMLDPNISSIKQTLLDKHYMRKHGDKPYYGQIKS